MLKLQRKRGPHLPLTFEEFIEKEFGTRAGVFTKQDLYSAWCGGMQNVVEWLEGGGDLQKLVKAGSEAQEKAKEPKNLDSMMETYKEIHDDKSSDEQTTN